MKKKVVVLFLLCFLINCTVIASPSLPSQAGEKQTVGNISEEVNQFVQHNPLVSTLTKLQRSLNENLSSKIKELKD